MPSVIVTANTTAQVVAAERYEAKHKITSLIIDNTIGAAEYIIKVVDDFTTSLTHGQAATATTKDRLQITVPAGSVDSYNVEDLEGIECIGALTILADAIDVGCIITVGYKTE